MKNFRMTFAALTLLCFVAIGCDAPNSGTTELEPGTHVHADGTVHSNDAHDHDHDHAHGEDEHPAHGPNGGHIFKFDSGYQGEWANYRASDLVRVYILDEAGKDLVPVKGNVVITRTNDGSTFELDAEKPDADGKAATYILDNSDLSIAMNLGVTIELKVDDKSHSGMIKANKPHKH